MLIEIEGKGYFKYLALLSVTAGMTGVDWVYMNLAYLVQKPVYQCMFPGSQDWTVCTEDDICGNMVSTTDVEWRIDWNAENSIHNW